ncbi:hypothetical protein Q5424_11810 [Conexibacter sp. JD483]|uniref:DUF6989 domain-containing protein n=1 Tax=unclassified Conexibacter TaxID=2627773 RepID=UPI002728002B|nr:MULTISPECIES: hypothetical protein [unclassified Conexibacter]MDO8187863.1 hypothetical protein [Conexibacter sp. CPCC 205706]MDO8201215.1 hypothetical protein [Conexibacter sp. CPCC 205762]MDR9369773.1 hypothetical protein [Conexibacter sp. JD483]
MRPIALFHAAFLACAAVALLLPEPPAKGWAVLALVVAYNIGLPLTARAAGRDDWVRLWAFLLPVSIFQILPDWVLAAEIGTLRFPPIGGPRIDDAIALAMGGMWVPPLFVVVATARELAARPASRRSAVPAPAGAALAAALALAVFLGTELLAPVLDLWEPVGDTTQVAGVALYVLPAEAALGWAAATAFALTRAKGRAAQIAAALAVSTFYTGALVLCHFLLDVAGWSIAV